MVPSIFGENLVDEFFEDPFGMMLMPRGRDPLYGKHARNLMKTDIRELDQGYEIDMDLPGFSKDQIKIDVKDGYLTVSAAKGLDKDEKKDGRYIRRERYSGQCSRSFFIGDGVEARDVSARFDGGILKLSLPKAEQKDQRSGASVSIE